MYVFYILVVLIGRYINQKIKISQGIQPTKNDFSSETIITKKESQPKTSRAINVDVQEYEAEEEYENEELTRPLLSKTNIEELPEVGFSKRCLNDNIYTNR